MLGPIAMRQTGDTSSPLKVLVVEDDIALGETLRDFLNQVGHRPTISNTRPDGLSLLDRDPFDFVLTDVRLGPDQLGGLDIVRKAKSVKVPCIVMTAFGDFQMAKTALNEGVAYFFEKPFNFLELKDLLEELRCRVEVQKSDLDALMEKIDLTPKESEVCGLLLKGLSNRDLATALGVSEKTIKTHVTAIFRKAGVVSRSELFSKVFSTQNLIR